MENFISLAVKAAFVFLGAVIMLVSVSFLMFGAAQGLSETLQVHVWFGLMVVGIFFLLSTIIFFMVVSSAARRKMLKKKAEQKAATEALFHKVSTITDLKKWAREYPFYSTGAAAVVGFTLSGAVAKPAEPSESNSAGIRTSLTAIILMLAEDVLIPFLQEALKPKNYGDAKSFAP